MIYAARLPADAGPAEFAAIAKTCLGYRLPPAAVSFATPDAPSLFPDLPPRSEPATGTVPRAYAALLAEAICHSNDDRFAFLYELLWRLRHGEPDLLSRTSDPVVRRLTDYAQNVHRDVHKMHAFVRFAPREIDGRTVFAAWHEPLHYILRRATPFFVDRFAGMEWMIGTPIGTAHWRDGALTFGPPVPKPAKVDDPVLDELWVTYYRTTFNPARLKVDTMVRQMPKHFWDTMPETRAIPEMIAGAAKRHAALEEAAPDPAPLFAAAIVRQRGVGGPTTPEPLPLDGLRTAAAGCTRCPLHGPATQTVFGEGHVTSPVVFVGEQPGDQEDLRGRPFIGPAGHMFDKALAEAGIDRSAVYVTNAVKHFKFEPRGKKRIHSKPNAGEIEACRWWIEREIAAIRPKLVVALGATAALSATGRTVSVTKARGSKVELFGQPGLITVHPSYLLRLPDGDVAAAEYGRFVADLRLVAEWVSEVRLAA